MEKKKIFIWRHGETQWNKDKRFQGHLDIDLNKVGENQAIQLKAIVEKLNISQIISSDLKRTYRTALIASDGKIPIECSDKLREGKLGDAQGKTWTEVSTAYGEETLGQWFDPTIDMSFPNGELKSEAFKRFLSYIESYLSTTKSSNIGISTHGFIILRFLHYISKDHKSIDKVPNAYVFELDFYPSSKKWIWHKK